MTLEISVSRDSRFDSLQYEVRQRGEEGLRQVLKGEWWPIGWNADSSKSYATAGWPVSPTQYLESVLHHLVTLAAKLEIGRSAAQEGGIGILLQTPSPGDVLLPLSLLGDERRLTSAVTERQPYVLLIRTPKVELGFVPSLPGSNWTKRQYHALVSAPRDIASAAAEFYANTAKHPLTVPEVRGVMRMIFSF